MDANSDDDGNSAGEFMETVSAVHLTLSGTNKNESSKSVLRAGEVLPDLNCKTTLITYKIVDGTP